MSSPETTPHHTPGSRLVDRLDQRQARRPKIGLSPEFYGRFGLTDPWSDVGQLEDAAPDDLFTFVSGNKYRTRMRRLAMSRFWRQRRYSRFFARRAGLRTMERKRFPGESKVRRSWGISTLSSGDMTLPPPVQARGDEEPEETRRVRGPHRGARVVDSPWLSGKFVPSRVMRSSDRSKAVQGQTREVVREVIREVVREVPVRQLDRMSARMDAARSGKDPIASALRQAMPRADRRTQARIQRVLTETQDLPAQERAVRVRKLLRSSGVRVARTTYEDAVAQVVPSASARPTEVARARTAPAAKRKRGLRPVMSRSPSMAVLAPDEPTVTDVSQPRGPARSTTRTGTRRVGWSGQPLDGPQDRVSLSRSPLRGVSTTRVARTPSGQLTRGARVAERTGSAPGSTTRTASAATRAALQGASVHRTPRAEHTAAQTHRTPTGSTQGARTGSATQRDFEGARVARTAGSDHQSSAGHTGSATGVASTARVAARVQRAARQAEQAQAETPVATAHAAARMFRGPASMREFTGARIAQSPDRGAIVSARVAKAQRRADAAPTPTGSLWALERLETSGTSKPRRGKRPSLLPRIAPSGPEQTIVVHADDAEQVREIVRQARTERPNLRVRVTHRDVPTQAAPATSDAHVPAVIAAAERALSVPVVTGAARQVLAPSRVRRGFGPPTADTTLLVPDGGPTGEPPSSTARTAGARRDAPRASGRTFRTPVGGRTAASARPEWTPSAANWSPARSFRTPDGRVVGARTGSARHRGFQGARTGSADWADVQGAASFTTGRGDVQGARTGQRRHLDHLGARVADLQPHLGARGAARFRSNQGGYTPGLRRMTGSSPAPGVLPTFTPELAPEAQEATAPSWAERTTQPTRIRQAGDLVQSLAGARDPEEVLHVILERAKEIGSVKSALPKPMLQVIEQIRTEAAKTESSGPARSSTRRGQTSSRRSRSSVRVVRGMTPLRGASSAKTTAGVGPDRVMKLAQKLRGLIHLAETGRTSDAQRQAKLAHADRPDSKLEGGGDVSKSETAAKQSVDIEALAREVLEVVNREMELRQERRQEATDADIWW
jgi:hypothetical protein